MPSGLELDPLAHEARRNGRPLELRHRFLLLELLHAFIPPGAFRTKIFRSACGAIFGRRLLVWMYVAYLHQDRSSESRAWCIPSRSPATS